MDKQIEISVAMTTYNGEKYLKKQLDSIFNQTLHVDEIIVCDDCSSDNTIQILKNYPITLIRNNNQLGFIRNFRQAIEHCHGNYIFLCDQDDIWSENKVNSMIKVMKKHPEIHVLASSFEYIDENDSKIKIKKMNHYSNNNLYHHDVPSKALIPVSFEDLIYTNSFQGCSLLIDKKIQHFYLEHFSDKTPHDWLLNLYSATINSMYFYNIPLFKYRLHEENTLGIPDVNEKAASHAKRANDITIRLQQPVATLDALNAIKKHVPSYYTQHKVYIDTLYEFVCDHINFIEHKRILSLFFQNFNPCYRKMKSFRSRVMDIIYILSH